MPKLTKKEFAAAAGVTEQYLNEYIKRGALIFKSEKFDTAIEKNQAFLTKRLNANTSDTPKEVRQQSQNLDKELKAQQLEKTREETELLYIKKNKLLGEHIPVDLVKSLVVQLSETIKTAYIDASNDLILYFSSQHQLNKSQETDLKKKLTETINKAVDQSVDQSKKDLKKMQIEYSNKRGRGEKK